MSPLLIADVTRRHHLKMTHEMRRVVALGLIAGLFTTAPVWALEFSADLITRANGKTRVSNLYYRDDRWRLEHQDIGPVNVTIVREDKQVTWLLIYRIKDFIWLPDGAN